MRTFPLAISLLLLSACAANTLKPGAERVRFLQAEPKGCKYLGEATGSQGNRFTGVWTSNKNLETGARNEIKNEAFEMGGNAIVMLSTRAGNSGSYGPYGGSTQQTDVSITATVFSCPDAVLNE